MGELLTKAFDNTITPEEEEVLDRLEAEWLERCRMAGVDEWCNPKPIIKPTTLN